MKTQIVSAVLALSTIIGCSKESGSDLQADGFAQFPRVQVTESHCNAAQQHILQQVGSTLTGAGITANPFTSECEVAVLHKDGRTLLSYVDASIRRGLNPLTQTVWDRLNQRPALAHVKLSHQEVGVISAGPAVPGEEENLPKFRAPLQSECKAYNDRMASRYFQLPIRANNGISAIGNSENLLGDCNITIGFQSAQAFRAYIVDRLNQGLSPLQERFSDNGFTVTIEISAQEMGEIVPL